MKFEYNIQFTDSTPQLHEALDRLKPTSVLWYGKCPAEFDWNVTKVKPFQFERKGYRK